MIEQEENYKEREFVDFEILLGKTLKSIDGDKGSDTMLFVTDTGETYRLFGDEDLHWGCSIEEIHGDLDDLIGTPILMAEVDYSSYPNEDIEAKRELERIEFKQEHGTEPHYPDSETWTFYKLATIKGSVTIRWYGSSNGYYSETATFEKLG
jgi:hypothetical protein